MSILDDLGEYVRLHNGTVQYRRGLTLYFEAAEIQLLLDCCSDNIVEVDGEDVIDFEAVRADFELAKERG